MPSDAATIRQKYSPSSSGDLNSHQGPASSLRRPSGDDVGADWESRHIVGRRRNRGEIADASELSLRHQTMQVRMNGFKSSFITEISDAEIAKK